jgi:xanthine dehydrogenase accessory factor
MGLVGPGGLVRERPYLPHLPYRPYNPPMNQEVFAALGEALTRGEDVALVTITSTNGSTPQRVGAKMLVFADGRTVGTIGGGCYENDAFWKAREALTTRKSLTLKFELNDDFAEETGLVCGGQMEVFIEPIEPSPAVYVFGAGHVGFYLARAAHDAGFAVHVVDDRASFANRERFPDAAEVVVDDIPAWLERTPLPPSAYAVIVTRGHRNDLEAVRALAPRPLRYLGLIGSRAKVARVYENLLEEGSVTPEQLERIHGPIGVDIGAVTPQEIAVSIVAELIAVRRGRADTPGVRGALLKWTPKSVRVTTGA